MPLTRLFDGAGRELRFAVRQIGKHPGFAAVAVLSLALGLGLNIAMFKVVDTLFLRPVDVPHSEELYYVNRSTPQLASGGHSYPGFLEIRRRSASFADVAAMRVWGYALSEPHRPADMVQTERVSAAFLSILRVQPILGRDFRAEEDQVGRNNVVILSHSFWVSRYGADPSVIGRKVRLDGAPVEIIGILPTQLERSTLLAGTTMLRPLALTDDEKVNWQDNLTLIIGRDRPGMSRKQTAARFSALAAALAIDFPQQYAGNVLSLEPLQTAAVGGGGAGAITGMLLALSGFVLFIACANLGNLLLARAVGRSTEFAVREALGASRAQVIAPIAAEAFLYAAVGGLGGALISVWTNDWMNRVLVGGGFFHIDFDWRSAAFGAGASLAAAAFCCVGPAWAIGRQRVIDQLKSGGRGAAGHAPQNRFRQAMIVGQFATALVLLTGAVFFARGVQKLLDLRAGWDYRPLVSGTLSLPNARYDNMSKVTAFYREALRQARALPGVESAAISYSTPIFPFPAMRKYQVEGQPAPKAGQEPTAYVNGASPDYFATMGTRLLRGRAFDERDDLDHERVCIINQDMARTLFPGMDPIGRRVAQLGGNPPQWMKIVGVAQSVDFGTITPSQVRFQLYQPAAQEAWNWFALTVRAQGRPAALVEPIGHIVSQIDPDVPVSTLLPVTDQMRLFSSDMLLVQQLVIGFAALGLFLAALGIYGVVAHWVELRTREIGIRMALGAQARQVVGLVLNSGLRLAVAGAAVGLVVAALLLRAIDAELPGLATNNVQAAGAAAIVLIAVAVLACLLPARRAARVNPMTALRQE